MCTTIYFNLVKLLFSTFHYCSMPTYIVLWNKTTSNYYVRILLFRFLCGTSINQNLISVIHSFFFFSFFTRRTTTLLLYTNNVLRHLYKFSNYLNSFSLLYLQLAFTFLILIHLQMTMMLLYLSRFVRLLLLAVIEYVLFFISIKKLNFFLYHYNVN